MWLYYYMTYGPGNQSEDYGYRYYPDNFYDLENARESLRDQMEYVYHHTPFTLRSWEIDRPPDSHVNNQIKSIKNEIKSLKEKLKRLESETCFVSAEVDGEDPVLQRNLRGCIPHDLLFRLHKAGHMYGCNDVDNWKHGRKKISEPSRTKILSIMRKTKKFPSYEKDKK